jgi:hypothetical protein
MEMENFFSKRKVVSLKENFRKIKYLVMVSKEVSTMNTLGLGKMVTCRELVDQLTLTTRAKRKMNM